MTTAYLTIGAFSRLVGVSADLLRVWERRYGLPQPARTANGRRLYSDLDEQLVRAMRRALAQGLPAAEAARVARTAPTPDKHTSNGTADLGALRGRLRDALTQLDETVAQNELDRLFGAYSIDTALSQVILPYLHDLGERWVCNDIGVGHEHFASNLIHGRLLSLARKWDEGQGPRVLLACPAGELHTIGLLSFGLALRTQGWRITYLGADTPIDAIAHIAQTIKPAHVVLASVRTDVYLRVDTALADLAQHTRLILAGAGANQHLATRIGATLLRSDPVTEAARLA